MAFVRYALITLAAVAINGFLYLLVPYLQVHTATPGANKASDKIEREVELNPYQPEQVTKRVIQEIKPISFQQPDKLTASRPNNPGGGLKIDLSPAGGDGPALLSGNNRTGGIGSGIGTGTGPGDGPMTYEMGTTDVDAKPIGPDPEGVYPPRARRDGVTGYAELAFVVNELGQVEQITIVKEEPAGYGFGKAASDQAKKMRFKPAMVQKMAVRMNVRRRFNFEL